MNKPNVAKIVRNVKSALVKHSPEILTGIGIAGFVTTTVLAVKATPKAMRLIEEAKDGGDITCEKLPAMTVVKVAWKPYIPALVTACASTACLIGASSVSLRRNAALAAAYQLSETALLEYRNKVVETIGEKKEQIVREQVAKEQVEKTPINSSEVIITSKGETLFLEPLSKRYFKSDIETVKRAENALNKIILQGITGYVSVNDWYDELGLDHTDMGDMLGWNVNHLIDTDHYAQIANDGQPCIVIEYLNKPKYDFDTMM